MKKSLDTKDNELEGRDGNDRYRKSINKQRKLISMKESDFCMVMHGINLDKP